MAFTTFAGPVRTGTVTEGSGRNTGLVVMSQSATVAMSGVATTGTPTAVELFTLPAGSKILGFTIDKTTAVSGGSVAGLAVIIGNATDDNQYLESVAVATAKGRAVSTTLDAGLQVDDMDNIGTSDVTLTAKFTSTTGDPTAGVVVITCNYIQRTSAGLVNPASV